MGPKRKGRSASRPSFSVKDSSHRVCDGLPRLVPHGQTVTFSGAQVDRMTQGVMSLSRNQGQCGSGRTVSPKDAMGYRVSPSSSWIAA